MIKDFLPLKRGMSRKECPLGLTIVEVRFFNDNVF